MKTELLADAIQLSHLICDSQMSWFTKAERVKRACRLAKIWSEFQVKATGENLSERDKNREAHIEEELPKLCYPYPVHFEALHARLVFDENREFYFPDLSK